MHEKMSEMVWTDPESTDADNMTAAHHWKLMWLFYTPGSQPLYALKTA